MMKRLLLLLCLLVIITCNDLFSQSRTEHKNSFYDAESWILFEAYQDALPIYRQLLKSYPDNSNFKYRIGQCYLNTTGEKKRAIAYLEDAVKNIDPNYVEGNFKETGAPYDALYYLANAYRINYQFDNALNTYDQFKKMLDPRVYDTTVVNLQIQSCLNARELIARPVFIRKQNLGNIINESTSEFNPVVSDDETMIVYSKTRPFYDEILFSVKINGQWSAPRNMNEILKVDRDLFPTSLSADGKTLYLYSSADYDGIIYSSQYVKGTWSPLVKLNDNINTKFWESHATISHDNNKLYITSNRQGTYGGLDIFVSTRDKTGDWGPAENLGAVINTPYNEESPFLSKDDKTLYFSSRGHFNMGGYDIFSSGMLDKGKWTEPKNAGYPLNTTDDDVFFDTAAENYTGFYAMNSPDGYGKLDIYKIEIFSDDHPRKFLVSGTSSVADLLSMYRDSVKISVVNIKKPGQPLTVYTNPATHEYAFNIPQGDYKLNYEGYGGEKVTRDLNLPLAYSSDNYAVPGTVLPRRDHTADLYIGGSKNITVTRGDTLLIPLQVEPQSMLTIENWAGNLMVSSKKQMITSPDFNYKIAPRQGDNRVVFRLADRFNNIATDDVFIKREKGIASAQAVPPEEVINNLAVPKPGEADPAITLIRNKIIAYSQTYGAGPVLRESMAVTDKTDIRERGLWLKALYDESLRHGLTPEKLSGMFVIISSEPGTKPEQYLNDLAENSEEPLISSLRSADLKTAEIKSTDDLVKFIITSGDTLKYPQDAVFKSLANLIVSKNIPADTIKARLQAGKGNRLWILLAVSGALVLFFIILFVRRRRNIK